MKKILIFFVLLCRYCTHGQIVTTYVGSGYATYSGDGGDALTASIGYAGLIAFDRFDNLYIGELNNTVRKVSASSLVSTYAGNGTSGYSGDGGLATSAEFNFTGGGGLACDEHGNLFIADQANNRIRKVDASTGRVTTIAGTGVAGYGGDSGLATSALINSPISVCFDNEGNLYFIDGFNYRIRRIDTFSIISTIAGIGVGGISGDGGPAMSAEINPAGGIHFAGNALYFGNGSLVRKIDLSSGLISSIAGTGTYGYGGDGGNAATALLTLAIDVVADSHGNIYISDMDNNRVRKIDPLGFITTFVGNGVAGFAGDEGSATACEIFSPRGLALDSCNNLFIADNGNHRIRKITFDSCYRSTSVKSLFETSFVVFPNPTTRFLNIDKLPDSTGYQLISIIGIKVECGSLKKGHNNIDITSLPAGIYLLTLTQGNGQRFTTKVIKQ